MMPRLALKPYDDKVSMMGILDVIADILVKTWAAYSSLGQILMYWRISFYGG